MVMIWVRVVHIIQNPQSDHKRDEMYVKSVSG